MTGDLRLSVSAGDEPFQPLGSSDPSAEKTKKGEVVYLDDARVLTRAWNHRDCEPTKIADTSTEFAIFVEDTGGNNEGGADVGKAVEDLKGLYESVFGGNFSGNTVVLNFHEGQTEGVW